MFTYSGRYRVSATRNEIPADDLDLAQLHIEDAICMALLEFVGQLLVERVELRATQPAPIAEYTLDIVLHIPDHSTSLRRDMQASARRSIDGTLRPLLTELFGHVRAMRTALTHADKDALWGEDVPLAPESLAAGATHTE